MIKASARKYIFISIFAFFLNLIWENAHSFLYASYKGASIGELILIRSALVDALIIFFIIFFVFNSPLSKKRSLSIFTIGVLVAFLIEFWALHTSRWEYSRWMPIVPILNVGVSPLLQLGLTGVVSYVIGKRV